MMVADTSVFIAIMREESDASVWLDLIDRTPTLMSVVSFVETNMVMAGRRNEFDISLVERTLHALRVTIVPVTLNQGNIARAAFLRFGKGRHSAALNIGDCFTYALAKSRDLPLLYKGNDFAQTDIVAAWRP